MDCQMPEMDGYQATKVIRRMKGAKAKLPIVAMTAHALQTEIDRCFQSGMDAYIAKPVLFEHMFKTLARFFKVSQADLGKAQSEEVNIAVVPNLIDARHVNSIFEAVEDDAPGLLEEMIESIEGQLPVQLQDLAKAYQEKNVERFRFLVHRLKGAMGNLGARHLAVRCGEWEDQAAIGELPSNDDFLREIADLAAASFSELRDQFLKIAS